MAKRPEYRLAHWVLGGAVKKWFDQLLSHRRAPGAGIAERQKPQSSRTTGKVPLPPTCQVPGLKVTFELSSNPGSGSDGGSTYWGTASGRVTLDVNKDRQRLYLFAHLEGEDELAGHLAVWLHTNNTAFIKKIAVHPELRRRGIASALYETFRAQYPGVLVEHGTRSAEGEKWWAGYCAARGLDPSDPRS